jgi:hypothetical protein
MASRWLWQSFPKGRDRACPVCRLGAARAAKGLDPKSKIVDGQEGRLAVSLPAKYPICFLLACLASGLQAAGWCSTSLHVLMGAKDWIMVDAGCVPGWSAACGLQKVHAIGKRLDV